MPLIQVKKVVAVCFLEAVKLTLEHLGAQRLELSQAGVQGSPDLPRTYGEVRRVRDFLQRCVSAYQDQVDLDLSAADSSLLVACCRRSVESIDLRLTEQAVPTDERQWLQRKRQVVSDWAVELAEKPLTELPLKRLSTVASDATRALTTRLQNKIFGDVRNRQKILPPSSTHSMATGLPSFGDQLAAIDPSDTGEFDLPSPPSARAEAEEPMGGHGRFLGHSAYGLAPEMLAGAPAPAASAASSNPSPALFDFHKIRDPRLRALLTVDLRAYERMVEAGDYRLSTVLLASILECAVLDHVLARRAEFGVAGSPDTWNTQELLLKALGDHGTPKDRALVFHLFAARNLLRPALQMLTPAVVTAASFERMREFVLRAVHDLGFGSPTGTLPPGTMKVGDC